MNGQKYGNSKIFGRWPLENIIFAGKFNNFHRFVSPPMSASPMKNWNLIFYYSRGDPGVPWPEIRNIEIRNIENFQFWLLEKDFSPINSKLFVDL